MWLAFCLPAVPLERPSPAACHYRSLARSAMQKPSQFPKAISAAFAAMLLLYSTLAACGYWYFVSANQSHERMQHIELER